MEVMEDTKKPLGRLYFYCSAFIFLFCMLSALPAFSQGLIQFLSDESQEEDMETLHPYSIKFRNSAIQKNLPLSNAPIVRVAVMKGASQVFIKEKTLFLKEKESSWKDLSFSKGVRIRCSREGIRVNQDLKGAPLYIRGKETFLTANHKAFRGTLAIYPDSKKKGRCLVVNHLNLEWYLVGLLGNEMRAEWNTSTLSAQAVAARTYALYKMRATRERSKEVIYDLESTEADQVYRGRKGEDDRTVEAVQKTIGQIISGKGKLIPAYYHSTCGGLTELPHSAWGKNTPGYGRVSCPYCSESPTYQWSLALPELKFETALKKIKLTLNGKKKPLKIGKIEEVEIYKRSLSGRALVIKIRDALGSVFVKASELRRAVGTSVLKSEWFDIKKVPGEKGKPRLGFTGHGFGHGVGMCQWGARKMGQIGKDYQAILSYYYPGSELVKLYTDTL